MFLAQSSATYRFVNDDVLIEQIKSGDQDAMAALHARYAGLVYSIVRRTVDDVSTAEECVQDTFMRVWQSAHKFDKTRGSLVSWMISIARNLAIDKLRQIYRRVPLMQSTDDDSDVLDSLPVDWPDRERISSLRMALEALPAEQRQVLELSYYGGMSQSDIAASCSLPLGTVKTRMRLAMQKLRDAWLQGEPESASSAN